MSRINPLICGLGYPGIRETSTKKNLKELDLVNRGIPPGDSLTSETKPASTSSLPNFCYPVNLSQSRLF